VSPVPSHEALQYFPSSAGGQVHGGFLHFFSSAILLLSYDFLLEKIA
jgi:hypothetical protein